MTDAVLLDRRTWRVPPPIDVSRLPQELKDLIAGWYEALKGDFKGLSADGAVVPDLFAVEPTGLSLAPMTDGANAFLSSLDAAQRRKASFPIDSDAWRRWSNIHRNVMRHGLCFAELSDAQREGVFAFVQKGLGSAAYETARNAMKLNEHLAELTGLPDEFGELYYWISIFGVPSRTEPWGWQLDGHHCNINCFVLGDQMVLSPMLLGAEPVTAESGAHRGTTVLREEEARGWAFMEALTPEQRKRATIGHDLPFDGYASGFKDNVVIPYDGLPAAYMTAAQRRKFVDLIAIYTERLPSGHAGLRLAEVQRYLQETVFAWIGNFDPVSPFYYRIYSPVIFVEFYHQPGVALPDTGYSRRHAHALVRTPNGNDYGRALLRQYRAEER